MKYLLILFLFPIWLNSSEQLIDTYLFHSELKHTNKEIEHEIIITEQFKKSIIEINKYNRDQTIREKILIDMNNDISYYKYEYSFSKGSDTLSIKKTSSFSNKSLEIVEITEIIIEKEYLTCKQGKKITNVFFKNDTVVIELNINKSKGNNEKLKAIASYKYYRNKINSVFNEVEDHVEYKFRYSVDTTYVDFVLPLHPFGKHTEVGYRSLDRDNLVIIKNRKENIRETYIVYNGKKFIQEITFLNTYGLDSVSYSGSGFEDDELLNSYSKKNKYFYKFFE